MNTGSDERMLYYILKVLKKLGIEPENKLYTRLYMHQVLRELAEITEKKMFVADEVDGKKFNGLQKQVTEKVKKALKERTSKN